MTLHDIDATFAVCFTGNKERHARLMKELQRVGIRDVNVVWGFPSPYKKFLLGRIPHVKDMDKRPGYWGATLCHYSALKTAYELGCKTVLIVEDDCRFLVDVGKIFRHLEKLPDDWDIVLLDHFGEIWNKDDVDVCDGYKRCRRSFSSACYLVNRRAMSRLIEMYESPVSGKYSKPIMRQSDNWTNDMYLGRDIKMYCADPRLAIQRNCGDTTNTGSNYIFDFYKNHGVKMDDYQPW